MLCCTVTILHKTRESAAGRPEEKPLLHPSIRFATDASSCRLQRGFQTGNRTSHKKKRRSSDRAVLRTSRHQHCDQVTAWQYSAAASTGLYLEAASKEEGRRDPVGHCRQKFGRKELRCTARYESSTVTGHSRLAGFPLAGSGL